MLWNMRNEQHLVTLTIPAFPAGYSHTLAGVTRLQPRAGDGWGAFSEPLDAREAPGEMEEATRKVEHPDTWQPIGTVAADLVGHLRSALPPHGSDQEPDNQGEREEGADEGSAIGEAHAVEHLSPWVRFLRFVLYGKRVV